MASERTMPVTGATRSWRRFKFPGSLYRYLGVLFALAFLSLSISYLNIPLERFFGMFGRIGTLIADRYYPPDIAYITDGDYIASVIETIQMAYLGALFGMLAAVPLGWFGAYNVTPSRRFISWHLDEHVRVKALHRSIACHQDEPLRLLGGGHQ